jgi:hypothetical protein
MKPIAILIFFCIIISCDNVKSQVSQKTGYQKVSGINPVSTGNRDTTFGLNYTSGFYRLNNREPNLIETTDKSGFIRVPDMNLLDLSNGPGVSGDRWFSHALKGDTLKGKWEIVVWRPDLVAGLKNSHSSRTSNVNSENSQVYRFFGYVFQASMRSKYPSLSAPNK